MKKLFLNARQLSPVGGGTGFGNGENEEDLKITIPNDDQKSEDQDEKPDDEAEDKDKKPAQKEKAKTQAFIPSDEYEEEINESDDDDDDDEKDPKNDSKSKDQTDSKKTKGEEEEEEEALSLKFDDEEIIDKNIDYTIIGKALNINLEENTLDAFVQKVSTAIEQAKQIVELDNSKYEPEAVQMFDYLQSGGSVKDFIEPLAKFDNFLAKTDVEKTLSYLVQVDGLSVKEAQEKMDELSIDQLSHYAAEANKAVLELRSAAVKDLVASKTKIHESKVSREREIREREEASLIDTVNKLTEFEGIPLSDANRRVLVAHIKSGRLQNVVNNNPKQIIEAYLSITQAETIKQIREKKAKELSRSGYNAADEKNKKRFTNEMGNRSTSGSAEKKKNLNVKPLTGFGSKLED